MLLPCTKRILISSLLIHLVQPSAFLSVREKTKTSQIDKLGTDSALQRPDISAPEVTIHINHLDAADDDLIFLTSWYTGHDGPYLFDLRGVSRNEGKQMLSTS